MLAHRVSSWFALVIAATLLSGCATLPRVDFSASEQALAQPIGFRDVRFSEESPDLGAAVERALHPDEHGEVRVLAMSGGGANGAYGAGLLYNWIRSGRMPKFQLVTGVSTGALGAPFAFVGAGWEERLKSSFLENKVRGLLRGRGVLSLITPGVFSRAPLDDLVRSYVTDDLLAAVAVEHRKGRRLLVATTNLDTEQVIVWDMGAIAAQGGASAKELFAEVLIASASVPGVYPPTLIPVENGERRFEEMHVDGQTVRAFFAIPSRLLLANRNFGALDRADYYVVINGRLDSLFQVTPVSALPIIGRSFDTAARASVRQTVLSTAEFCKQRGCHLLLSSLPKSERDDPIDFSAAHINSLFRAGQAAMSSGAAWRSDLLTF